MRSNNKRILAIDPGSRELGYVVLDGLEILDYGVKNCKRFRPQNELKKMVRDFINRIIAEYAIKVIVVEKGHFSQIESPLFNTVYKTILQAGNKKPIKVIDLSPVTIRKEICGELKPTKRNVAKFLSKRFPEMKIEIKLDLTWKEKYWQNVFDALAVGVVYSERKSK